MEHFLHLGAGEPRGGDGDGGSVYQGRPSPVASQPTDAGGQAWPPEVVAPHDRQVREEASQERSLHRLRDPSQ